MRIDRGGDDPAAPDGATAYDVVRWLGGHCHREFATYVHGTKCAAQFNTYGLRYATTGQTRRGEPLSGTRPRRVVGNLRR